MPPEVSRGLRLFKMAPVFAPPRGERCAVCRGVDISVPHQANCSHWFCGHCIVGVWLHGSVLRPSGCPVCRRPITLLVLSEVDALLSYDPEITPVVNRIALYNGRFAGAPHNMIQWLLDQPFYIRRMLTEFRYTHPRPPLFFKVQVALAVALSVLYLVSPVDIVPEGVLVYRGLVDDMLVFVAAYAYISSAYRAILLDRHALSCEVLFWKGEVDVAELKGQYPPPPAVPHDEAYFKHNEKSFGWYFDPEYCRRSGFDDCQRLVLRHDVGSI